MPSEDCFPDATKPASISQSLCEELQNHSYAVSYQDEDLFLNCFTCNDAELIQIENLIDLDAEEAETHYSRTPARKPSNQPQAEPEKHNTDPPIIIRQPTPLRLSRHDCLGCPGLIDRYHKLVKLVRSNNKNKVNATYCLNRTSSEYFRDMLVRKEITRFISLLFNAGSDLINTDILNKFTNEETIVAKLDEKEEESQSSEAEQNQSQISQNQSQTQISSSQIQVSQSQSQAASVSNDNILTSPKKSSRPQSRASQKQREPSSPLLVTND